MSLRYMSICSGIEAATVAWDSLGFIPVAFSEIEPFPCALLKQRYPHVPNHGDMTKFKDWPNHAIDALVGGTPCQAFSIAGLRKGLADPRGNLTLTFLGIVDRYRPRWVVWENVPGVLSDKTGAFGSLLGGLGKLGYGWAYRVMDAQYFGVAQRRRRVFVVGHFGAWQCAAAVLFEQESMRGDSAPCRQERKDVAGTLSARTDGGGGLGTDFDCDGGLIPQVCPTLRAGGNSTGGHRPPGTDVDTCESLIPSLARCDTTGEAKRQDWETCTIIPATAHTLRANGFDASEDGSGRNTPLVPVTAFGCKDSDPTRGVSDDISPTLRAMGHSGSHANAGGQVAVAFQSSQSGVRTGDAHATLDANNGSRRHNGVVQGMAVRRLTPRECERLQGFPDDYTAILYRGKSACDGPRYKALGNSMAVPVMKWIGQRIAQVDQIIP